ncbi:MAG TPA: helix-turn-helix domain-containing protein [Deltaproteobacteria bacterium]|nr:helix-turn-helix domain-containing protein [Deltaproteobacteria bacterium]
MSDAKGKSMDTRFDFFSQALSSKVLLTTKEAAALLGIGKSTLDQDRLYGRLRIPFIRLGRSVKYRLSDIEAYLKNLKAFTSTSEKDEGVRS